MLNHKPQKYWIIILVIILVIVTSTMTFIYYPHLKVDKIDSVEIGEVGMAFNYSSVTFPGTIHENTLFKITIITCSNISIHFIYTQTPGFCVHGWSYRYGTYLVQGGTQGQFTGSVIQNHGIITITIKTPKNYFAGAIAIHIVGKVPVTVVY